MPGVYILIPAYNEEKTIARVILDSMKYGSVIVCDDGSTDYTGEIASRLGALVVRHDSNRGYGAALKTLFRKVLEYNPDIVITLDADLQHDPSYIPRLIEAMEESGADIVIGMRSEDDETPPIRRVGVKMLSKAMPGGLKDVQSGFRVYRGDIIHLLIPSEEGMAASIEIIEKALENNLRIVEVPIRLRYKGLDTSTMHPVIHGYDLLSRLVHSYILRRPITFLGLPGLIILLTGFVSGLWVVYRYMEVRELAIGTAIATAILVIIGFLLMLMAIQIYAMKEYARSQVNH